MRKVCSQIFIKALIKCFQKLWSIQQFMLKSVRMTHDQCLKISYHCSCSLKSLFIEKKALVSRTDSS